MRSKAETVPNLLAPVTTTGRGFYVLLLVLAGLFAWFLVNAVKLQIEGHGESGLSTPVGAAWGIAVANIIFFIGVSHVGIGVSAATRLLNLHYLRPYVRIAELLTMVCLPAAVITIALDLGRTERFLWSVMQFGQYRSPMLWSATVISVYFVASSVYLYLSMRRDIAACARKVPKRAGFYRAISLGYEDTEESKRVHEKVLWWLALVILPIMISVHSVYGFIFGLQGGRPGWFNPFQAPYFVLGAIVSGFATLILVIVFLRWLFRWQQHMPAEAIRSLGRFLSWMTVLYIYFSFAEYLTFSYNPPAAESTVGRSIMTGEFAQIFWTGMVALVVGYFVLLLNQTIFRKSFRLRYTVIGALMINVVLYVTRYLIVVPSLLHPLLPYSPGSYTPTFAEWSLIVGIFTFAILAYVVFMKLFPIVELPEKAN
ncbi:MAG: polysulfide reductase NrfD [Chloroflexi bacterium]|nr:polysulfide reductase NrfD [Chloroflexota bacterium]